MVTRASSLEREIRSLSFLLAGLLFIFFLSFGVFLYMNYTASKELKEAATQTDTFSGESTSQNEGVESAQPEVTQTESESNAEDQETSAQTDQVQLLTEEEVEQATTSYVKGYQRVQVGTDIYTLSNDKKQLLKNDEVLLTLSEGTFIAFGIPKEVNTIYAIVQDESDPKTTYFMQYIKSGREWIPKRVYRFESVFRMVDFVVPNDQVHATSTPKEFYLFLVYQQPRSFKLQVRHLVDYTPEYEIKDVTGTFESIEGIVFHEDRSLTVTVKTNSSIERVEFFKPE